MNRLSKSVKYKHSKMNSDELHYVDIKCHKCGEALPYTYAQLIAWTIFNVLFAMQILKLTVRLYLVICMKIFKTVPSTYSHGDGFKLSEKQAFF